MKLRRRLMSFLIVGVLLSSVVTLSAEAAPADRATLKGSAPRWANTTNFAGASDASASVGFRVYLGWNNESAAADLARAVSDPRSASYGQYLTPAQFRRQFSPDESQVGAV